MEILQLAFTLFALLVLVGLGFYLLSRMQPQRVKALRELAQKHQWHYQNLGGLPRSALQLTFASVNPAELRQHGRCISAETEQHTLFSCDASYVDTHLSTQTLILVVAKDLADEPSNAKIGWHLLLGKRRQLDQFDQFAQHQLRHVDSKLGMAYRSDQPQKALQAMPYLTEFAEKNILVEWLGGHLILYKPNHILEPDFIEDVFKQATKLYEKLNAL